jgi:hypothetical protein
MGKNRSDELFPLLWGWIVDRFEAVQEKLVASQKDLKKEPIGLDVRLSESGVVCGRHFAAASPFTECTDSIF